MLLEKPEVKEPIEGFFHLEELIQKNLALITGKPLVQSQGTQAYDTGLLGRVKALGLEIEEMREERKEEKLQMKRLQHKFEED
mmetsp:Transcript_27823/g.24618  ORF Transcript_27823/g.24618 Transcript_27823/m.24618 type:complete len:83 (+) Transcript_27823:703-951(+)